MLRTAAFKQILINFLVILSLMAVPTLVLAGTEDFTCRGAGGMPDGAGGCNFGANTPEIEGENSVLRTITNALLFLVGATAVIYLIINGIRFITGGADAQAIANARQGIIYGIVGVVIALASYAIVNFVAFEISNPEP